MVDGGSLGGATGLLPVGAEYGTLRLSSGSVSSSVGNLQRGTGFCQGQAAAGVNAFRAAEGLKCGVTT